MGKKRKKIKRSRTEIEIGEGLGWFQCVCVCACVCVCKEKKQMLWHDTRGVRVCAVEWLDALARARPTCTHLEAGNAQAPLLHQMCVDIVCPRMQTTLSTCTCVHVLHVSFPTPSFLS